MTNSILLTFLFVLTLENYSWGQSHKDTAISHWLTPKNMTPLEFIEIMKFKSTESNNNNIVTMPDSFANNWLTKNDIDTLIKLVNSKEKCKCYLNPLSSNIPTNESGEVGGLATWLIKAYKEKSRVSFGLYACPKVDQYEAGSLIKWWTTQSK